MKALSQNIVLIVLAIMFAVTLIITWQGVVYFSQENLTDGSRQVLINYGRKGQMKIVELIRLETSEDGSFGLLRVNKKMFCMTLEPPDKDNKQNVSCIPTGQYICRPYISTKYGTTWEVANVPDRTYVLFHAGNVVEHTRGCILVGSEVGKLRGSRAVLNSGNTFKRFAELVGVGSRFHLTIKEEF